MVKLQKASGRNRNGAWQRIWDSLTGNPGRMPAGRKPRRLMIDQLEERQLLSVSPASLNDVLVNQVASYSDTAVSGKSVAADNNGDFVVTWSRTDYTTSGQSDENIYARYYTDAVQRIDLPTGATSFMLQYNGNAIDTLSVSAGTAPFQSSQNPIKVAIKLKYGSTNISTINYDETKTLDQNATEIQTQLQAAAGAVPELDGVVVQATDAHNFIIKYGPASNGHQSALTVASVDYDPTVAVANRCFLPAAEIVNARIPGMTMSIPISTTNPSVTAANIEYALKYGTTQTEYIAPIVFPDPARVDPVLGSPAGPYNSPLFASTTAPNVKVSAVSATKFEITFIGDTGKLQQPLMTVLNASSTPSNPILLVGASAEIIKQTSNEFRVNDTEVDDHDTLTYDAYDQSNAQVAMDSDGDFIITWQSVVPNSQDDGSVSDIYARTFTPSGYVAQRQDIQVFGLINIPDTLITDKKPGGVAFTFNGTTDLALSTTALNLQKELIAEGYDPDTTRVTAERTGSTTYVLHVQFGGSDVGNVISDIQKSQDDSVIKITSVDDATTSFLADMNVDGTAETGIQNVRATKNQFMVNTFTVNAQSSPSVGMDAKGNFTIAWESQGQNLSFFNQVKAQRYDFNGNPLGYEFAVSTENTSVNFEPYVAVSNDGAIAIGWCNSNDPVQYLNGIRTIATLAKVYDAQGNVLMDQFSGPGAGIDGISFDSKDNFVITGSHLATNDNIGSVREMDVFAQEWELYDANGNKSGAVLRPEFRVNSASFDEATNDFWPDDQSNSQPAMDADGDLVISYSGFGPDVSETDIDSYIAQQLIAYKAAHPGISDYLLGLQRLDLENRYGLLRGEANAAMFSQFDADPHANQAPSTILTSDDIANNLRDGSNQTYLFAIDRNAVSGGFTLRLYTQNVAGYVDVDITPVYYENNGPVDPYETLKAIHNALTASGIVGINWPETAGFDGPFDGPISVRLLTTQEITNRVGTAWDPTLYNSSFNISGHVYEITFQGELHDSYAGLYLQKNDMKLSADPTAEVQRLVFSQTGATTPTGSFTFTIGGFTSTPIGFNTANMNAVAANIESQLQAAHPGATVFFNTAYSGSGGSPWVFDITFGGATDIGIDQPRMYISLDSTLAPSVSAPPSIELIKGHAEEADAIVPQLMVQTYYDTGTYQYSPSIAMSSDGDFVVIWNQYDPSGYSSSYLRNIYYRTFQESTDTAGPTVANAFSSSGSILDQNTQVNVDNGLQHVVLSFDEEMQNTAETQTLTFAPTASNGTSLSTGISDSATTISVGSSAGFPSSGEFQIKVDDEVMLVTGGAGSTTWTVRRHINNVTQSHLKNAKVQSSFLLKIGDLTSVPLWYNSVDPSTMVGSLQTAIETLAGGLGGVSVSYNKNTSKFQVTFGGNYRGLYVPLMQTVMDPAVTFKGTITPALQYDSVTNPMNYRLLLGNAEVPGSVINVEYGLNKASELAALAISDPANYGQYADLSILPTNKWEAIITIDGNGTLPGTPLLASGTYTIQALTPIAPTTVNPAGVSGLRDLAGNPLGYTGYEPNGVNYSQQFELVVGSQSDTHTDPNPSAFGSNGYTSQESPGAVAVDADGDHIVTWTAYDSTAKCDRVYFQKYYTDGTHSDIMAVTAGSFAGDAQGYATVACDADGDFVITWTNYRDENGDAGLDFNGDGYVDGQPGIEVREQVDVYAQRFTTSNGSIQKVGSAFRVNTYTTNDQLWSNVAMNAEGAFVITWSSMGQEDNGQNGSGYGIYARRYDSFGQPIGPEFQVNITTANSQQNSSVAMSADGGFVVVWQSAQNGNQNDIIARSFNPDGSPQGGPYGGEVIVNSVTVGSQRYPDVAMNLAGTAFVVSWESPNQDESGWGVYSRPFTRLAQSSGTSIAPLTHQVVVTPATGTTPAVVENVPFGDIQASVSTISDQYYTSVAMAYDGSYIVTWSGNGTQANQSDSVGVYYQRYAANGTTIGLETRANISTTGNQWISSIGADASGNFVIVWTGVGSNLSETDVYRYISANALPTTDHTGAIVTDMKLTDGTRVQEGDTVQPAAPGISQMIVVFSENMYTGKNSDGTPGLHSILNPQNWSLDLNGAEVTNAISNVGFGLNPLTHKYEAVLTFKNALAAGNYMLIAHDGIWDAAMNFDAGSGSYIGNVLDGDYNGTPGTNTNYAGQPGFSIQFAATITPTIGAEHRVNGVDENGNSDVGYNQQTSQPIGTGMAQENSTRAVAMDHSGDFAVVWTSYGQDNPSDSSGGGIYMRMYDRNDNPLTADVLVNSTIVGSQHDANVAMDADGDFVVVWQSDKQDPDGSAGIYAQRFNSMGKKVGGEFRVNTNYTNGQVTPEVAMDNQGNFVVVWATQGQFASYFNDIHAQRFDHDGNRIGSEFMVNTTNISGVQPNPSGGWEASPTVSMNGSGQFIVAWEQVISQYQGIVLDTMVAGRLYNADGTPRINPAGTTDDFRVDTAGYGTGGIGLQRSGRNPQAEIDDLGNVVVGYEFYDVGYATYRTAYQMYHFDGSVGNTWQSTAPTVSLPGAISRVNTAIAMDAVGNWVFAFDGHWAEVSPSNPTDPQFQANEDTQGVFIGSSTASGDLISTLSRVNITSGGDQKFPSISMTPDGDFVVVWSGNGVGDRNGIFFRRYKESTDTAGPELTDFLLPDGTPINSNQQVGQALSAIVVTFDEAMLDNLTHSGNAVTNPANFKLLKDGVEVVGGITQVFYGLNMANTLNGQYGITSAKTNKYEAVLIVDDNGAGSGILPLTDGHYQLVAKNSLRDAAGNPLHSTGVNPNGDVMSQSFNVTVSNGQETQVANSTNGGKQTTSQSVAGDADGDHVVVWTNTNAGQQGVYFKIYNVIWTVDAATNIRTANYTDLGERLVTNDVTATEASVARDADGDFVVTWTAQDGVGSTDIYAQLFDATGNAKGVIFRVNTYAVSAQSAPAVAMGTEGDFVITWQSLGQDKSGYGIYAQRFSRDGERLGGTNEIQTLSIVDSWTGNFSLLWDDDNNADTGDRVTSLINYSGNMAATSAAVKKALADIGANVEVMVSGTRLSIIFTGNSASINQSLLRINPADLVKTGGLTSSARIEISTVQDGDPGEFRVNDTTVADQTDPSIAMDKNGNFVISWTSSVQDAQNNWNTDVYAKKFATSGSYWNGNNVQVNSNPSANSSLPSNASIEPMISTVDDPTNHLVTAGTGFDGVVQVNFNVLGLYMGYGSGVLLAGSNVILTAAHVATFQGTSIPLDTQFVNVTFDTPTGPVTMGVSQIIVNPGFTGFLADGNDIAMIVLDGNAPTGVTGYDIYRGSDEVGQVGAMYGYGITGTGAQGETGDSNNEKYSGSNRIDATSSIFGAGFSNTFLMSDFDSGLPANDAMGIYYNVHDLGLGVNEAALCSGDSGGPMLVNGKIAGIASFGLTLGGSQDSVPGLNSSFGEFFGETRVSAFASWIDSITAFSGGEFLVNADDVLQTDELGNPTSTINNTSGDQKWSSVGMDDNGDFVITWTSAGHDGSGNGYGGSAEGENGVFARRYNAQSTQIDTNHDSVFDAVTYAASNAFQINDTTGGDQQHATVAMDADGDFTVAWESSQSGNLDVYAKRYIRTSLVQYATNTAGALVGTNPLYGPNGEIGAEFAVNSTKTGNQSIPSITMDEAGDFVVVWNGAGKFDTQGIYLQRFNRPTDDAGPIVADALAMQGSTLTPVAENSTLDNATSKFVITFGENVSTVGGTGGANSILNPSNWVLLLNGQVVPEAVSNVEYGLSQANASGLMASADGKYEAVVTFKQALGQGSYVLTLKESVQDLSQNNLDGNFDGTKGGSFVLSFTIISSSEGTSVVTSPGTLNNSTDQDNLVNTIETGEQITPAVAADAQGNYVVVWATDQTDSGDIMAQRYDRYGRTIGRAFLVSSFGAARDFVLQSSTSPGFQTEPVVAMDSYGNFVVVWAGTGANDDYGIYARVFDVNGAALGDEFLVNEHTANVQNGPSVAMDADGDFVVSWTSYGQDGDRDGVYAKRFNILGQAQTNELQVNTTGVNRQQGSDVAMDANGNFVVTWESDTQDGSSTGIYAQRFNAGGTKLGGEFLVNQNTSDKQDNAKVAMDSAGNFVVTWSSFGQDGSGYGIYARRYNQAGTPLSNEFLVNQTTLNWQVTPDVGMDTAGNFVITWSSQRDSNVVSGALDYGIYARMYNADGSDFVSTTSGQTLREWRVNAQTIYNQMDPAVGVAQNGQFTIVWASPDNLTGFGSFSTGVYSRVISPKNSSPLVLVPSASTIGLLSPNSSKFYLKNSNTAGNADTSFAYGPAGGGWISISGDWDGDGIDTIGLYSPVSGTFYLKNNNAGGYADIAFVYGPGGAGWTPIVGDWDGNGIDTIGLYNSKNSTFYLRNTNDAGAANITSQYGPAGAGWKPVAGDWDGNGTDTIGLYSPASGKFFLRNTNNTGIADITFVYGPAGSNWTPLAGDWDADGHETIGLYSPASSKFYLRNTNTAGVADSAVSYGPAGGNWIPIVGTWTRSQALVAADGATTADAEVTTLTQSELQPIVNEAISRWAASGLDDVSVEKLKQAQFTIGDLSDAYLGKTQADQIYLDSDAAGHGWFVDSTPASDEEYSISTGGVSQAIDPRAVDRIDLLSVVEHELGHIAGLDDLGAITDNLMSGVIEAGVRRTAFGKI